MQIPLAVNSILLYEVLKLKKVHFKGDVSSIRTLSFQTFKDKEYNYFKADLDSSAEDSFVFFNKAGNITEEIVFINGGYIRSQYHYCIKGERLDLKQTDIFRGDINEFETENYRKEIYTYDDYSRLIFIELFGPKDNVLESIELTYTDNNIEIDFDKKRNKVFISFNKEIITVENEGEMIQYNNQGDVMKIADTYYDTDEWNEGNLITQINEFKRTRTSCSIKSNTHNIETYVVFNEQGDIIEEGNYNGEGEGYEISYEYQYDKSLNWTRRASYLNIIERIITYHQ